MYSGHFGSMVQNLGGMSGIQGAVGLKYEFLMLDLDDI
jgi:hypothetical protein